MTPVTDKLNLLLADSHVFFTKLHNYHWNIKGLQFLALHQKTEEYYTEFATIYDDLAERALQLGEKPVVTLKKILEITRIQEETERNFTAQQVVSNILKDFEHFYKEFRELSSIAGDDVTTTNYADDKIAYLEKEMWMMRSMLGE